MFRIIVLYIRALCLVRELLLGWSIELSDYKKVIFSCAPFNFKSVRVKVTAIDKVSHAMWPHNKYDIQVTCCDVLWVLPEMMKHSSTCWPQLHHPIHATLPLPRRSCDTLCMLYLNPTLALYPGPYRRERAWYTLCAHALGDPRKNWGKCVSLYICPFTVHIIFAYIMLNPWTGHYGKATGRHGEAGTCAHNVYQALSPPHDQKGLGMRLLPTCTPPPPPQCDNCSSQQSFCCLIPASSCFLVQVTTNLNINKDTQFWQPKDTVWHR